MVHRMLMLALILIATPAIAEVKAVIDGPAQAKPGDLVVLSGLDSIGQGVLWVSPDGVQTLTCSERELAFAVGTPGRYRFGLIVADTEANIDYTTHTITIGSGTTPDPKPDPNPQPEPGEFDLLKNAAADLAKALRDTSTAAALAAAIRETDATIERACSNGQCPGLESAKAMMVQSIESALSKRTGNSRNVNWLGGWRRPMDESMKSYQITTVPRYRAAMRALATGLEAAS